MSIFLKQTSLAGFFSKIIIEELKNGRISAAFLPLKSGINAFWKRSQRY